MHSISASQFKVQVQHFCISGAESECHIFVLPSVQNRRICLSNCPNAVFLSLQLSNYNTPLQLSNAIFLSLRLCKCDISLQLSKCNIFLSPSIQMQYFCLSNCPNGIRLSLHLPMCNISVIPNVETQYFCLYLSVQMQYFCLSNCPNGISLFSLLSALVSSFVLDWAQSTN